MNLHFTMDHCRGWERIAQKTTQSLLSSDARARIEGICAIRKRSRS